MYILTSNYTKSRKFGSSSGQSLVKLQTGPDLPYTRRVKQEYNDSNQAILRLSRNSFEDFFTIFISFLVK